MQLYTKPLCAADLCLDLDSNLLDLLAQKNHRSSLVMYSTMQKKRRYGYHKLILLLKSYPTFEIKIFQIIMYRFFKSLFSSCVGVSIFQTLTFYQLLLCCYFLFLFCKDKVYKKNIDTVSRSAWYCFIYFIRIPIS